MDKEIVGGVSPLKKRGGKAAKRVTRNATGKGVVSGYKGRGGYSKSGGGKNPGGYNVHTRFKPRAKQEGPKGGTAGTGKPTENKPYTYDKDGKLVININNNNTNNNTNTNNLNQKQKNINTNTNHVEKENDKIITENKERSGSEFKSTPGEEHVYESYDKFWSSRIDDEGSWSPGMKRYMKGVDINDPDAVEKARLGHKKESIAGKEKRDASRSSSKGQDFQRDYNEVDGDRKYNITTATDPDGWFEINKD